MRISTRTRSRARRTSFIDRTWLDHWTVLALLPIRPPDVAVLRSDMLRFMQTDPTHPLCCTLQSNGRRWRPVDPEHRKQHLEHVIVNAGAFDRDDPFTNLKKFAPPVKSSSPYKVVVGPDSIILYFAHAVGDAAVFSPFSVLMALGDVEGLRPLRSDVGLPVATKMLLKELQPHWREWLQHMRSANRGAAVHDAATESARTSPGTPATATTEAVGTVLTCAGYQDFNTWRKASYPGLSATALMASAVFIALTSEHIRVSGDGFYTLVDLRRHLPKNQGLRPANLAKSAYVPGDMANPAEVGAGLKQLVESARAVPALFSGALSAAMGRTTPEASVRPTGGVAMTFNSMMRNPGVDHIPWADPGQARYITMSYPIGADGISVTACAVEGRLEFSASFNPGTLDRRAAQRAVNRLQDIPSLLQESRPPTEAETPHAFRIAPM